jgi:sugar transferase (PEP-CTERM/EpsH1 system associated)
MRILVLAPYSPYPPRSGGALRIYNLVHGLSLRHELTCLTFVDNPEQAAALEPLRQSCRVVTVQNDVRRSLLQRAITTLSSPLPDMALRNASPSYRAALERLLREEQFELVLASSIEMGGYGLLARSAASKPKIVLDEFNAEYVLQQRTAQTDLRRSLGEFNPRALLGGIYSSIQSQKLRRYEQRLLRDYDHVLAVSHEDRVALAKIAPEAKIAIVPNGVDTDYFDPNGLARATQSDSPQIVFTGTLNFRPNIDAITWFVEAVWPRVLDHYPKARLVIVGKSPAPVVAALHNSETIEVHADVPDVRPFIAAASVYIVPMRMGGGVRLKFLEALAMQAPIVTTSMGAEGVEGSRPEQHYLVADTAADFGQQILRILQNPALAEQLGRSGRSLARDRYDWRVIVPALEAVVSGDNNDRIL